MATLSIWKFPSADSAEDALRTLARLQRDRLITVDDASVVSWQPDRRKPRTWQAPDLTGPGALSGAFWGLLFGLLFMLTLVGMAIGAASGATTGALSGLALSDEFLQKVRDQITPGTSALFVLTSDEPMDRVEEAFAGTSAELLVTNLSHEQEERLRHAFEAAGEEAEGASHSLSA